MNSNYFVIGNFELISTFVLIIVVLGINYYTKADMGKEIIVGSLRCFIQLMLVGYLLKYIFNANKWYWVLLTLTVMILIAGADAVRREKKRGPKTYIIVTSAIAFSSTLIIIYTLSAVVKVKPWYNPQYLIPIMGMLIGNAMNGASLVINRLRAEIETNRQIIEAKLALGANIREAAGPHIRESIKSSMIPTINSLMVIGLVTLPGMMTGQIIAGSSPLHSVRYQIAIMYMITASNTITILISALLSYQQYFTKNEQLTESLL